MNVSKQRLLQIILCLSILFTPHFVYSKDNSSSKFKGYMGLDCVDLQEEDIDRLGLNSDEGALITKIIEKSSADKYGLAIDDVIVQIDNKEIGTSDDFLGYVASSKPGDRATITYFRNGETHTTKFVFGSPPKPQKPSKFVFNNSRQLKIEQLLDQINEHNKSMGCLSIGKNNKVLYSQAIGYKSIEADMRADIDTKYRIGSISKMFTAVMIFQMIDEGKLTLETKLNSFYPMIPNAETITIQMMLRHESGIFSLTEIPGYFEWNKTDRSHEFLIEKIQSQKPAFYPGEKHEYSNSNYLLLGYIVELLDKCDYSVSLENRVTHKIGLKNTYYGSKIDINNDEALSYQNLGYWQLSDETDMSIPGGAGAIVSTASDLIVFIEALFNNQLMSKMSFKRMLQDKDGMGSGIFKIKIANQTFYGHTGSIDGFVSILIFNPRDRYSMAYLSNGIADIKLSVVTLVSGILTNQTFYMPQYRPAFRIDNIGRFTGTYNNDQYQLEITMTEDEGLLYSQVLGQAKIRLEAIGKLKFECASLGVSIEFSEDLQSFTLSQWRETVVFSRSIKE